MLTVSSTTAGDRRRLSLALPQLVGRRRLWIALPQLVGRRCLWLALPQLVARRRLWLALLQLVDSRRLWLALPQQVGLRSLWLALPQLVGLTELLVMRLEEQLQTPGRDLDDSGSDLCSVRPVGSAYHPLVSKCAPSDQSGQHMTLWSVTVLRQTSRVSISPSGQ